jgi:hypothetical protein
MNEIPRCRGLVDVLEEKQVDGITPLTLGDVVV